jgi:hypothetical protein
MNASRQPLLIIDFDYRFAFWAGLVYDYSQRLACIACVYGKIKIKLKNNPEVAFLWEHWG